MALVSSSGSLALRTSSGESFERYSREDIAGVVPSTIFVWNLLTLCLQTFIAALEKGDLDQENLLRGAANLALNVGRVGDLDVLWFRTTFDNIYHVVDMWREASATDAHPFLDSR